MRVAMFRGVKVAAKLIHEAIVSPHNIDLFLREMPDPIIHRDVSSANVLLEPIGSGNWKAKVSDYGSANFLSKVTTMGPGNVTYAAPESLNPKRQSPKMDVYSYGILLLEMATRKFPDYTLMDTLIDTLLWQEIATVIRRCICEDPVNHPTMKDLLILMPQLNR